MTTNVYSGWSLVDPWGTDDFFEPGTGIRIEPTRKNDYCLRCRAGDHSAHLRRDGTPTCKRGVDPVPYDFPCKCVGVSQ